MNSHEPIVVSSVPGKKWSESFCVKTSRMFISHKITSVFPKIAFECSLPARWVIIKWVSRQMTTVIFNFTVTSRTFASERTIRVGQRRRKTHRVAMSIAEWQWQCPTVWDPLTTNYHHDHWRSIRQSFLGAPFVIPSLSLSSEFCNYRTVGFDFHENC